MENLKTIELPKTLCTPRNMQHAITIAKMVCNYYGYKLIQILEPCHKQEVTYVRFVIFYFLQESGFQVTQIGKIMQRHHSAIIHGLSVIRGWIDVYPRVSREIKDIRQLLANTENSEFKEFYLDSIQIPTNEN